MPNVFIKAGIGLFWFFCLAIGLVSVRLLWPGVAGTTPNLAYHYDDRAIALIGHIAFAVTALLVMPFQFNAKLRGS